MELHDHLTQSPTVVISEEVNAVTYIGQRSDFRPCGVGDAAVVEVLIVAEHDG